MNKLEQAITNCDFGKVIYDTSTGMYYCGLNTFKNQLRDARVYHGDRYLQEAIQTLVNKHKINPNNIEIREVELKRVVELKVVSTCKYL